MKDLNKKWHNKSIKKVSNILEADLKSGLRSEKVKNKIKEFGKNKLPNKKALPKTKIFLNQFKSPLVYILLLAAVVTILLQEYTDAIVLFTVVFVNTLVGFIQENKASQALAELGKVVKYEATVIRGGHKKQVPSDKIIPGDILLLEPGDKVTADGRIIESEDLKINEMALTGEWLPAEKEKGTVKEDTVVGDRTNMVFTGTIVEDGNAKILVTETGLDTEIGKITKVVETTPDEKTPLQKKLLKFSHVVGILIGIASFLIFLEGIFTGKDFIEMFTTSVAIAVAAIPEGLPIAMTIILAIGMQKILDKKGLVRKLSSAETLGGTSIICTDKTATLTEGKMSIKKTLLKGSKKIAQKTALLCNGAFIDNPEDKREEWDIHGSPTEKALLIYGLENFNVKEKEEKDKSLLDKLPFDTKLKLAAALEKGDLNTLYIAGAPEKLIKNSTLSKEEKNHWKEKLDELSSKGYRVLGIATKETKKEDIRKIEIEGLNFNGLLGLFDPLREEVKGAFDKCQAAGMKPIIITGDYKLTAKAIADELNIPSQEENIIKGEELEKMSDKELDLRLEDTYIYARVEPKHKMRIVEAWQKRDKVVAMTGDGINDAPALKRADIGVATGSGTAVAKEIADLVLLSDSFSIIVAAIEEGRAIIDNLRKVITYLLADSFSEIILVGLSIALGLPLPLTAVQILWINLVEDGPMSLVLGFEPKEKDIMKRKPQGHDIPLLTKEMKAIIFIIGLVTDLFLVGIFFYLLNLTSYPIEHIQTVVFSALAIDSLFYIFSCKNLKKNIWDINLFSNKFLLLSWLFSALMLLITIYLEPLQRLFGTVPLNFFDWQLILSIGLLKITLIEITKWFFITRKYKN